MINNTKLHCTIESNLLSSLAFAFKPFLTNSRADENVLTCTHFLF